MNKPMKISKGRRVQVSHCFIVWGMRFGGDSRLETATKKMKLVYNQDRVEKIPCVETRACLEPEAEESGMRCISVIHKSDNHVPLKKSCQTFGRPRNKEQVLKCLVKEAGITYSFLVHIRL